MAGRTALVTGAARGIGEAIAAGLASEGHAVALADLRVADAAAAADKLAARGARALGVEVDVTDGRSVLEAIEQTRRELGEIDILVNNAGWDELRPFVETDEEFWNRVIEINYKGALRTTRAILPGMTERGWGRIVNIGSDAGRVGSSLESVYAGAKGAVIAFTKTIAREAARYGVTANTVCPGPTRTPLLDGMANVEAGGGKLIESLTRAVPMRRLGRPEDVAGAVVFFASEQAAFITGQTLSVSGGLTMA